MFKHCKEWDCCVSFCIKFGISLFKSAVITETSKISSMRSYWWGWLLLLSSLVGFFLLIHVNSKCKKRACNLKYECPGLLLLEPVFDEVLKQISKIRSTTSKGGVIAGCDSKVALFHRPAEHRASDLGISWLFQSWFFSSASRLFGHGMRCSCTAQ